MIPTATPTSRPHRWHKGGWHQEQGQAAIEFALTLTTMLLVVFGMIDFSRAVYTASVVQWAAQQGARAGIVDEANVTTAVRERMVGLDADTATVAVSYPASNIIQVDVSYEFEFIIPMVARITGDSITLQASASMVRF